MPTGEAEHAGWVHRHPHLTTALFSVAFAAAIAALVVVAGEPTRTAALSLASAPALFAVLELASLALRVPVVPAALTGSGGRRFAPASGGGDGLYGPEWGRGGEMVDSSGGGVDYGGGDFGGGGDGGGG